MTTPLTGLLANFVRMPGGLSDLEQIDFSAVADTATGTPGGVHAVRLAGQLNVATGGRYSFHLDPGDGPEDGVELFVDGVPAMARPGARAGPRRGGP